MGDMTTHDNAPPPADWTTSTGHRCAGCGASPNLCHCLSILGSTRSPCCEQCTHADTTVATLTWAGDDN